jgi:hypothetical protein
LTEYVNQSHDEELKQDFEEIGRNLLAFRKNHLVLAGRYHDGNPRFMTLLEKITKAGWGVLSDPKKLSTLLTTLNIGSVLSVIKGVWDLIFASDFDINWLHFSIDATVGGIFYFKLAIFLFAVKVVLGVIGGAITLGKVVNKMVGFIKDLINLFTSKKEPDAEPPAQQNNEPLQESLIRLFEMYGYQKNLI